VEHPCEKCGFEVEDGVPFCRHCRAPQIRVIVAPNGPAIATSAPEMPSSAQPLSQPVSLNVAPGQPARVVPRLNWSQALPGAALAGLLLCIGLMVPYAPPFLVMMAAGGLAAGLYARRSQTPMTPGLGARVGILAGLVGWAAIGIVFLFELTLGGGRLMEMLRQAIKQQIADNPDPRAQEFLGTLTSPGGMVTVIIVGMLFFLVVALVCGTVGGAAVAAFFRRKDRGRPQM
jgi:hypothetical protein